jgi:hypothetical protein
MMMTMREEHGCPCLRPTEVATCSSLQRVAAYCRLPHGRVRIPTPDERVRLCIGNRYHECLQYQRARLAGMMSELD